MLVLRYAAIKRWGWSDYPHPKTQVQKMVPRLMPSYGPRWLKTLPSKMLGTVLIVHFLSDESSSPLHDTALPGETMWISPCGCLNPRKRPGTMGIRSCSLLMRTKSGTLAQMVSVVPN